MADHDVRDDLYSTTLSLSRFPYPTLLLLLLLRAVNSIYSSRTTIRGCITASHVFLGDKGLMGADATSLFFTVMHALVTFVGTTHQHQTHLLLLLLLPLFYLRQHFTPFFSSPLNKLDLNQTK